MSWDSVSNANRYYVYIIKNGFTRYSFNTTNTSYDVSSYLEEGTHNYNAKIYAFGNKGYPDSDWATSNVVSRTVSSALPPLTNVQISPLGIISWDPFPGATKYAFGIS